MTTNGPSQESFWPKTAREFALVAICVLPAIGGYFRSQYRLDEIQGTYVSHDQLALEVQKTVGDEGIKAVEIQNLTDALKANNEELVALQLELKQMRMEWSNYRGHR